MLVFQKKIIYQQNIFFASSSLRYLNSRIISYIVADNIEPLELLIFIAYGFPVLGILSKHDVSALDGIRSNKSEKV